jgi:hypothetical protein
MSGIIRRLGSVAVRENGHVLGWAVRESAPAHVRVESVHNKRSSATTAFSRSIPGFSLNPQQRTDLVLSHYHRLTTTQTHNALVQVLDHFSPTPSGYRSRCSHGRCRSKRYN